VNQQALYLSQNQPFHLNPVKTMDLSTLLFERNVTKDFLSKDIYNKVLFESENFIVIPSLGSLVKGWLLIVPKRHVLSFSYLPSDLYLELEVLVQRLGLILEKEFGPITIFEHGSSMRNSPVGCGVDYAHLHVVPININLIEELEANFNYEFDWNVVYNFESLKKYAISDIPYLYVKSIDGSQFVTTSEYIPSQLFRKVIANYLSIPDEFDWKKFHKIENIQETIKILSKYNLI
jgi:ATP adenylyltransferase